MKMSELPETKFPINDHVEFPGGRKINKNEFGIREAYVAISILQDQIKELRLEIKELREEIFPLG